MAPKLETAFTRYEADLLRLRPNSQRGFVCPICLKFFARTENLAEDVAIEHIVPEALAGQVTTLTCRRCNNTAGSKLDSHLVQRVRIEGRRGPIQAGVEFCGTKFRGEVHLPDSADDSIRMYGIRQQSDPREIDNFGKLLSEGIWDGQNIKLDLKLGYEPVRSLTALLRSAYLLMFRLFGYSYVFDKSAEVIRKSITEPLVETDALKGISWKVAVQPPTETGISIVTKPKELRSFIIFLTLDRGQDHVSAIALPPPNTGTEFFHLLDKAGNLRRCTLSSWRSGDNEKIMPLNEVWQYEIGKDAIEPPVLKDAKDNQELGQGGMPSQR